MNKEKLKGNTFLIVTSIIWGSSFVAQRVGMDYVGPLTFIAVRFWLGAIVLLPSILINKRKAESSPPLDKKTLLLAGGMCGIILFAGSSLQQYGLLFTTAGKAGFITALYIVLVPVFGLALKHKPGIKSWFGVALATVGLYFLTITESLSIAKGDFIVLIGALFWAAHVLVIDHFNLRVDSIKLAFTQFAVSAALGTIGMFIFEAPSIETIINGAVPLLYAGVLSSGIGFTFQIIGQRYTSPTVASLILSMEAVFSAIFGFLILRELMSTRELAGCILMFFAVIISQLPDIKERS